MTRLRRFKPELKPDSPNNTVRAHQGLSTQKVVGRVLGNLAGFNLKATRILMCPRQMLSRHFTLDGKRQQIVWVAKDRQSNETIPPK